MHTLLESKSIFATEQKTIVSCFVKNVAFLLGHLVVLYVLLESCIYKTNTYLSEQSTVLLIPPSPGCLYNFSEIFSLRESIFNTNPKLTFTSLEHLRTLFYRPYIVFPCFCKNQIFGIDFRQPWTKLLGHFAAQWLIPLA